MKILSSVRAWPDRARALMARGFWRSLHALEGAHLWFVDKTGRMEPLFSLGAIAMMLLWALGTWDIDPNPDSYYHMGLAAAYAAALSEGRWLEAFPVLPFTILAEEPFPNVYLLQHLMLAPLARVLGSTNAIYTAMGLTGFALLASIYFVLRGWKVRGAIWWTQLPWLISPSLFAYVVMVKGAAFFMIWTIWALDALVRRRYWQLWFFSLLACYSYVASYLLIVFAGCFALAALIYRRRFEAHGIFATGTAWLISLVANPGFPSNLDLITLEFRHALEFPGNWEAGIWTGAEWSHITLHSFAISLGFALIPWMAVIAILPLIGRQVGRTLGGCMITCMLTVILAFYAGSKGVSLAAVVCTLLLPLALHHLSARPWMSWVAFFWLAAALGYSSWQGYNPHRERLQPGFIEQAIQLARIVNHEAGDHRVVLAPWYDFPWLFYFNPRNYYVAGMNTHFLRHSPPQFGAYLAVFSGNVRHPEVVIPRCFLSNLVVVDPGFEGGRLLEALQQKPEYFSQVELPRQFPRLLFKIDEEAIGERLRELDSAEDPLPICADPPEAEADGPTDAASTEAAADTSDAGGMTDAAAETEVNADDASSLPASETGDNATPDGGAQP